MMWSLIGVRLKTAAETWLVIAYDPPRRPRRIAPPSLRAAPIAAETQLTQFARDLDRAER